MHTNVLELAGIALHLTVMHTNELELASTALHLTLMHTNELELAGIALHLRVKGLPILIFSSLTISTDLPEFLLATSYFFIHVQTVLFLSTFPG